MGSNRQLISREPALKYWETLKIFKLNHRKFKLGLTASISILKWIKFTFVSIASKDICRIVELEQLSLQLESGQLCA